MESRKIARDIVWLMLLWSGLVLSIFPVGEWPQNDDWAYARTVKTLLYEGKYVQPELLSPIAISHVAWGTMFCLVGGFSFMALRLSTITLGLAGVLGLYLLLRVVKAPRSYAFLGASSLAANPIYLSQACTFMSDVPFVAHSILAILCLTRYTMSGQKRFLVIGCAFTVCAALCRQFGLLIPVAFGAWLVIRNRTNIRAFYQAVLLVAIPVGAYIVARQSLHVHDLSPLDLPSHVVANGIYVQHVLGNAGMAVCYLGLFAVPMLIAKIGIFPHSRRPRIWIGLVIITAIALGGYAVVSGSYMPTWRGRGSPFNALSIGGIGPITLYDVYTAHLPHGPSLPAILWKSTTILSAIAGGMVIVYLVSLGIYVVGREQKNDDKRQRDNAGFVLLLFLLYALSIIMLKWQCCDRYVLLLTPLTFVLIALQPNIKQMSGVLRSYAAVVVVCGMAIFSIMATRDYMAWNRARWSALQELMANANVPLSNIDGGYEFNGWYCYRPGTSLPYTNGREKSWWWVDDNEYLVTMGNVEGYEVVREYPVKLWLSKTPRTIKILHRI